MAGGNLASAAGLTIVIASAGCIAPDAEVIGALGVTVDDEQRPILVVEACEGAATGVDLFFDREGLADDGENVQVAAWVSEAPVRVDSVARTEELRVSRSLRGEPLLAR